MNVRKISRVMWKALIDLTRGCDIFVKKIYPYHISKSKRHIPTFSNTDDEMTTGRPHH